MRHVSVREHRTAIDWAEEIRYLVDVSYPGRNKIMLVMDNLNTHALSSLYKAFPAPEARRIAKRLEIHYTPKHGSWLLTIQHESDTFLGYVDLLRGM